MKKYEITHEDWVLAAARAALANAQGHGDLPARCRAQVEVSAPGVTFDEVFTAAKEMLLGDER